MNIFERGQATINRVTNDPAGTGVSVLYTRGATTNALVVTPANINQDTTAQPSPTARNQDRERFYFIVVADLVAAGFGGEPVNGDRVTEVLGGVPQVWEFTTNRTEPGDQWNAQRDRVRIRCIRKVLS